jgi:hypothetical protein
LKISWIGLSLIVILGSIAISAQIQINEIDTLSENNNFSSDLPGDDIVPKTHQNIQEANYVDSTTNKRLSSQESADRSSSNERIFVGGFQERSNSLKLDAAPSSVVYADGLPPH